MFLLRTKPRLWEHVNKVFPCQHRGAVTAYQVDLKLQRLVLQGDTHRTAIQEVNTIACSIIIYSVSRYTCPGVVR